MLLILHFIPTLSMAAYEAWRFEGFQVIAATPSDGIQLDT